MKSCIKKYKLAIFDMDGTILDTLEDLCDATNFMLHQLNCPERTIDEVRQFVGNGIPKLIERAMPEDASDDEQKVAFDIFMSYYNVHRKDKTKPYDGIIDLLKNLRFAGIKTAVVSNKRDEVVKALCQDFFDGLFDISLGDREGISKKPDRSMVDYVLSELNISSKEAVYIGDSDVDLLTAQNAEMDYILVTWGFRTENFLRQKGASVFAHTIEELFSE